MIKLLLLLLLTFTVNVYSQNRNDDGVYGVQPENKKEITLAKSSLEQAGMYLDKSSKYQYGALGCATFATSLFVWYGCTNEKFELKEGKTKLTNKSRGLIIGGSVLALLAIICEANAIEYKIKAGKCLRLQSDENSTGLAFVF